MTHADTTWFTGEWFTADDAPDPAFEGVQTGTWNGWAEWKTTRAVCEQIAALAAASPYADILDKWSFDGDILVVDSVTYADETPIRVLPGRDGMYQVGLGMVWTRCDWWGLTLEDHSPQVSLSGEVS